MSDLATTNGKGQVDLHPTSGGPQVDPKAEKMTKSLLVRPSTHTLVAEAADRLDRTFDACVKAGILLLNAKTEGQRKQGDDDWAKSIGGK
jgi:hypothetical protein